MEVKTGFASRENTVFIEVTGDTKAADLGAARQRIDLTEGQAVDFARRFTPQCAAAFGMVPEGGPFSNPYTVEETEKFKEQLNGAREFNSELHKKIAELEQALRAAKSLYSDEMHKAGIRMIHLEQEARAYKTQCNVLEMKLANRENSPIGQIETERDHFEKVAEALKQEKNEGHFKAFDAIKALRQDHGQQCHRADRAEREAQIIRELYEAGQKEVEQLADVIATMKNAGFGQEVTNER